VFATKEIAAGCLHSTVALLVGEVAIALVVQPDPSGPRTEVYHCYSTMQWLRVLYNCHLYCRTKEITTTYCDLENGV
jgi:hypothetical protein